jgi:SAM-dependent methyltransferase
MTSGPNSASDHASYTDKRLGVRHRVAEALSLLKHHTADVGAQVAVHLTRMDAARADIEAALGAPLTGKHILEIGPGQQLRQARYFAADNQVTAVDLDEVVLGTNPIELLRTLRVNGSVRFFKTVARKVIGIDRRFVAELVRQRPGIKHAAPTFLRRDATHTGLPSESFDCIMSYSVFEHLPDPEAALREISRLLRPGGVSHHVVHLYSSDSGAHDVRTFATERAGFPYWCHLRPELVSLSASNCYVNKVSLTRWLELIEEACPGAVVRHFRAKDSSTLAALAEIRATGALAGYSDEDLLTDAVQFTWKKPGVAV